MKVIAKKNRELALINAQNTQNENRAEIITLVVPEEYEDYNKKIVFVTDDGTVWDVITNNEYKITNAITKYDKVDFYIWLTKEVDGESIDFRTKTKTLNFYHNEDASDEITDEEIHGVNTVVNLLEEEIEKVENLNIEATKIEDTTTITITKKDGTTESVEINDGIDGQDGQDGYTPQKGIDYFTEQDIEEIETDVKNDLEENVLVNYSLIAETGAKIELSINTTDYKLKAILKDKNNNIIHTSNVIDLPLETMVVNATYDNVNKAIILTLQNGTTVSISVADLVSGLVSESQLQTILANYYTKTEINNLLANKVDKVAGKGLSTNDFTDEYKEQVDTNTENIENIQDEQTEQNTDIEKLQEENARLKATLPTTTGEGQTITLNKTAELEFKKPPLPMGNSEQEGEPSPDNEVPITNVTGDVEVVVENKNLIDYKTVENTSNTTVQLIDNGFKVTGKYAGKIVISGLKPNTNYYLQYTRKNIIGTATTVTVFAGALQSNVITSMQNSSYFNTGENTTINIWFYTSMGGTDGETNFTNIQLEESTIATDYVEHKSQTFTFPLGNEKLMLGDYLADDGIHHVRGQVVLDGSENWGNNGETSDYGQYLLLINNKKYGTTNIISNKFITNQSSIENCIAGRNNSNFISITVDKKIIPYSKDNFKTWLQTQYNNETPVTAEYELEEEVIVPYTSAQQEVYNQIKQALSYEEQTNISSNTIALFSVEAYQDAKVILAEKGTYSKPSTGIPKTDLASDVQTSLGKADTAIQSHQDISGKANKISVVQTSTSTIEINSNTFYKFGEVVSLNITLASITDNTIYNEYMFEFVSGSTATTLTLPSSIKWLETPTIDANKIYQCSIVDNVGLLVGVTNV